jgi:hypothetical protein
LPGLCVYLGWLLRSAREAYLRLCDIHGLEKEIDRWDGELKTENTLHMLFDQLDCISARQ